MQDMTIDLVASCSLGRFFERVSLANIDQRLTYIHTICLDLGRPTARALTLFSLDRGHVLSPVAVISRSAALLYR